MEQRPLRLGDILDDYCPRERRVTNHAIVAMIEEDVRQTRCTTCDAEHVYKGGKAPRRRKKDTSDALYKEVLAGMPDLDGAPILTAPVVPIVPAKSTADARAHADDAPPANPASTARATDVSDAQPLEAQHSDDGHEGAGGHDDEVDTSGHEPLPVVEEGPVHRPLIRATLPRPEGQKEVRQAPDFTMRQPIGRGHFRGGGGMKSRGPQQHGSTGNGNGNGNTARSNGGSLFAGPRPCPGCRGGPAGRGGGAPGGGFRSGQPRQGGGGRKRSR